jgi:hypothetical protein
MLKNKTILLFTTFRSRWQSLLPEDGVTLRNVVNNKIVLFLSICGRC